MILELPMTAIACQAQQRQDLDAVRLYQHLLKQFKKPRKQVKTFQTPGSYLEPCENLLEPVEGQRKPVSGPSSCGRSIPVSIIVPDWVPTELYAVPDRRMA